MSDEPEVADAAVPVVTSTAVWKVDGDPEAISLELESDLDVPSVAQRLFYGGAPAGVEIEIDMSGPGKYIVHGITQQNVLYVQGEFAEGVATVLGLDNRVMGGPGTDEPGDGVDAAGRWLGEMLGEDEDQGVFEQVWDATVDGVDAVGEMIGDVFGLSDDDD